MTNVWFTSDTHYGHSNVIKYCDRPFANAKEMDETLIENYNSVITNEDYVYHLGDFCFKGGKDASSIFNKLNGKKKFLIKGNHDAKQTLKLPWDGVYDVLYLKIRTIPNHQDDPTEIFLSHYAHRVWNKAHHGSFHCFGHSHNSLSPHGKSFDCGVDAWNYFPISLLQVKERMENLASISHH